ncbi:MAG: hypothetical protein RPR40_01015 [Bermanella sp.]
MTAVIIYPAVFNDEVFPMSTLIHTRIEDNLKEILPLAQKADEILVALKLENKGRFSAIFPKHSLFKVKATLFLPYLEEASCDLKKLPAPQDPEFETLLTGLLKKIELLHQLLGSFHEIQDDQ